MHHLHTTSWLEPIAVATNIPETEDSWILLYSGMESSYTGRYSILALDKREEIKDAAFEPLENKLSTNKNMYENAWFGYLGYGLKNQLEKLPEDTDSFINQPDLWFINYGLVIVFDHHLRQIKIWGDENSNKIWEEISKASLIKHHEIESPISLQSNMSRKEYLDKVFHIKESIKKGDLYQANLTRKFFGEFETEPDYFDIFTRLCNISPAPYSAFAKHGSLHIISSSPERFLHIDKTGLANIRPIKGSAARQGDDAQVINKLRHSEKDRAENLMIVDLSRNDLSRTCLPGSVKVDELFSIETYATVHHMVSSISGLKRPDLSALDLIKGCLPPGSMTGTPKIKAMELCSHLEQQKRGIYSGAIGWLGGDGSADFSVIIRTIIMEGNKFEFQVGGAIVNDSTPEAEFTETMVKAKAVAAALGVEVGELEGI